MTLYLLTWRDPANGQTQQTHSPLVPHKGWAVLWLIQQRPYLVEIFHEIKVEPFRPLAVRHQPKRILPKPGTQQDRVAHHF